MAQENIPIPEQTANLDANRLRHPTGFPLDFWLRHFSNGKPRCQVHGIQTSESDSEHADSHSQVGNTYQSP